MRRSRVLGLVVVLGGAVAGMVAGVPGTASAESAQVRFAESSLQAVENRGPVRIVVERVDLPVSRLLVHYRTEDATSSAVAGTDYLHTAGTLVFDVGVQSSSFTVFVRDDEIAEETEHLLLHLETSSGTGASTRLTILDDDLGPTAASGSAVPASGAASSSSSAAAAGGGGASAGRPAPVVVASSAGSRRPVATATSRARVTAPPKRRIILEQTPTTPFELRPVPGALDGADGSTAVDPLLALGAGLLLARVGAEAWFRARIALG